MTAEWGVFSVVFMDIIAKSTRPREPVKGYQTTRKGHIHGRPLSHYPRWNQTVMIEGLIAIDLIYLPRGVMPILVFIRPPQVITPEGSAGRRHHALETMP